MSIEKAEKALDVLTKFMTFVRTVKWGTLGRVAVMMMMAGSALAFWENRPVIYTAMSVGRFSVDAVRHPLPTGEGPPIGLGTDELHVVERSRKHASIERAAGLDGCSSNGAVQFWVKRLAHVQLTANLGGPAHVVWQQLPFAPHDVRDELHTG